MQLTALGAMWQKAAGISSSYDNKVLEKGLEFLHDVWR